MKDWLLRPDRPDTFVMWRSRNRLFGTKAFKSKCLALRFHFAKFTRNCHAGFGAVKSGVCADCITRQASSYYALPWWKLLDKTWPLSVSYSVFFFFFLAF